MKVLRFCAEGLRNLEPTEFEAHENVNIIYGDNAQGKTNLLEGMWLFTGLRSFRGAKDGEIIAKTKKICTMEMDFFSCRRKQNAKIKLGSVKSAELNSVSLKTPSMLAGNFCAVVFSPIHLSLIKDGPSVRRRFIDSALCQAKPSYSSLLSRYSHALIQRNTLLHDATKNSQLLDLLDMWNHELCISGAPIISLRKKYIQRLNEEAQEIYHGISGGRERLDISYSSTVDIQTDNLSGAFADALLASLKDDLRMGSTCVGPHRDNLEIKIDGMSARSYASQGQQRSCVLALKLAEASLVSRITGEQPVALLDDVMSELDAGRQDYLLNRMNGWQVFITCCDPHPILRLASGSCFEMNGGRLALR